MVFVPQYTYDIFVSYARVDDLPESVTQEGWVTTLVLHHSEFDGRALYRVQSGQPMHRRMTSDAPEKVPCDAQR